MLDASGQGREADRAFESLRADPGLDGWLHSRGLDLYFTVRRPLCEGGRRALRGPSGPAGGNVGVQPALRDAPVWGGSDRIVAIQLIGLRRLFELHGEATSWLFNP